MRRGRGAIGRWPTAAGGRGRFTVGFYEPFHKPFCSPLYRPFYGRVRAPRSEEDARLEPLGGEGGLADDERLAAQAEDEATSHDDKQAVVLHAEGHHELAREDEEAADGAADADPCAGRRLRAERWAVNRRINIPR